MNEGRTRSWWIHSIRINVCALSTGGEQNNRWSYANGYVNSPAWHVPHRVAQIRNVMVHATPRTLTNRFIPAYPRWEWTRTVAGPNTRSKKYHAARRVPDKNLTNHQLIFYRDRVASSFRVKPKQYKSLESINSWTKEHRVKQRFTVDSIERKLLRPTNGTKNIMSRVKGGKTTGHCFLQTFMST